MGKRKTDTRSVGASLGQSDLRLILEFDGTTQPVSEWLEKLEIVCELLGITDLHRIVPLRLKDGAFAVYQQLTAQQKETFAEIKNALLSAFALDKFQAYERFIERKKQSGEPVDSGVFGRAATDGEFVRWCVRRGPRVCVCGRPATGHTTSAAGWSTD